MFALISISLFAGRSFTQEDTLYCQTRSLDPYNDSVEVVAAKPLEIWWHKWDGTRSKVETPLLLSCPLTEPLYRPAVVSVVTQPCDNPTNAFALKPLKKNKKRMFSICVKDMKFHKDISRNLIEWIETNKILGVDIIDVYIDEVTRETEKVLLHYQDRGYVRLFHVPIKYKSNRSLWQRRRDHLITYNDCLYRNIIQSTFVVPLDVDEIILPKIAETWPELLVRLQNSGWNSSQYSSIIIRNVFFFDFMQDVNKYNNVENVEPLDIKLKMYVKRDDVRIKKSADLEADEIEMVDDFNLNNELIDYIDEEEQGLREKYKLRCGHEMKTPKLVKNIVSSAVISPVGDYSKSWMLTEKVVTAFNHYPLTSLGTSGFAGWSPPFAEVQLNHYKESCNTTVVGECERYGRRARVDTAARRLRAKLTRALAHAMCTNK